MKTYATEKYNKMSSWKPKEIPINKSYKNCEDEQTLQFTESLTDRDTLTQSEQV